LQILVLILGICIFAIVAYGDIRTRRIPNELVVAILALAAFRIALTGDPSAALYTLAASVALFAATFLLFWRGLLGGGDVKLLVATGFLIGYHDLFQFLFVMSICGALVALAVVAHKRLGGAAAAAALEHQEPPEPPARLTVPYGVAISAAGIVTLLAQSFPPG
jgi:prepilin peptidase CpaA